MWGGRGKAWQIIDMNFLFKNQINFKKKIAFVIQITQNIVLYHFWGVSRDLKTLTSLIWGWEVCGIFYYFKMFTKAMGLRRWRHTRMVGKSFLTADLNSSLSSAPLSHETWGK